MRKNTSESESTNRSFKENKPDLKKKKSETD